MKMEDRIQPEMQRRSLDVRKANLLDCVEKIKGGIAGDSAATDIIKDIHNLVYNLGPVPGKCPACGRPL